MAGTLFGPIISPNLARSLIVSRELGMDVKVVFISIQEDVYKEPYITLNVCFPIVVSEELLLRYLN